MSIQEITLKVVENAKDIEWMKIAIFGLYGYIPLIITWNKRSKKDN